MSVDFIRVERMSGRVWRFRERLFLPRLQLPKYVPTSEMSEGRSTSEERSEELDFRIEKGLEVRATRHIPIPQQKPLIFGPIQ